MDFTKKKELGISDIQHGTYRITGSGATIAFTSISFPRPFKKVPYVFIVRDIGSNDPFWAQQEVAVSNRSVSGFTICRWSSYSQAYGVSIDWIAIEFED